MNKKQELMKFCRLYKGEVYNPYNTDPNKAAIWDYERAWLFESVKQSSPLLNLQAEYDMITAKRDKSFIQKLASVKKIAAIL